jgi:hypothetical protein
MTFKPPIQSGKTYEVSFKSNSQSQGTTLITVGWIPNLQNAVPAIQDMQVAPAAALSLHGQVPSAANARRMAIRADLPDGNGGGTLTLKEDGIVHSEDQLSADTDWTCLVI